MEAVPLKQELKKQHTYEEAIEATSVGRFNYFLLGICGLCYMAGGVEVGGHSVLILSAECDLNLSLHDKGLIVAVGFFGYILSLPVLGYSSDTFGRVRTIKTTLISSVCMSLLSSFSVNKTMLIVTRFLTCVLISATQSSVFTLITEFNSNKTRLRHLTILAAFVFAGTFYFREKEFYPCQEIKEEEGQEKVKLESLFDRILDMGKQTVQLFKLKRLLKTAHLNFIALNTAVIGGGVAMWMPSILTDVMGSDSNVKTVCGSVMLRATRTINVTEVADVDVECSDDLNILPFVVMTCVSICMFVISLATSTIVNLIGRNGLIVMWLTFSTISCFAVYASDLYIVNILSVTLIINAVTINGNLYGVASEIYPTSINSMGVSLVIMMTSIGCLLGSYLVGPLVLYYCYQTFLVFGCLLVLVIVLVTLLPNNKRS
uniref:Major facilitator superfamily (MFS) profile domain-containing protein n=1 Tax=Megaselia scalaris TaxID=36166 RepID=T1GF00_MEGSC